MSIYFQTINERFTFLCARILWICRYDIQSGIQDPYDDCVATMRLYMRMRYHHQVHKVEDYPLASDPQNRNNFASWRQSELERMTPEQMLEISRSDYYCWCLDSFYSSWSINECWKLRPNIEAIMQIREFMSRTTNLSKALISSKSENKVYTKLTGVFCTSRSY